MIDLLRVINLHKNFGNKSVLKGISFEVKKRTIHGFLGPNGAGKTTTLKILTGLISFDDGKIFFDSLDFTSNKNNILSNIGYLPQNPVFYGYLTPVEYLNLIAQISKMDESVAKKRIAEVLEIVKLSDAKDSKISTFSGGMIQRLGIATAIINKPIFLLLDEPTSALDPEGRAEILEYIKSLKEEGITVFFSTHILNDVERICDSVSIINEGQIITTDRIENLKKRFIQPIFCIELENIPKSIKNEIVKIPYVQNVQIEGNNILVHVNDVEAAKKDLLKFFVQSNLCVLSFYLKKPSLEDIFVRLVNNNVNI